MKKFVVAVLSAIAAIALCLGLVGCDLFGGGESDGVSLADMAGEYRLTSMTVGGKTYSVGDTYMESEVEEYTAYVELRYMNTGTEVRLANITCRVTGHVYYYVGNWSYGKGKITFKGSVADSLSSTTSKNVTITGTYKDNVISYTYDGVTLNMKK